MKTLSQKQLRVIGSLSNQAYKKLVNIGGAGGMSYEDWRHDYTAQICGGIESWKQLDQRHYVPLCNALLGILGRPKMADNTPKTDEAALIYTLRERMAHWEAPKAYVARIIANKTGRSWITAKTSLDTMLAGLDCETLRQLIYTLERACRNLAKRDSDRLGVPVPPEVHNSRSTVPPARLASYRGDILPPPLPPTRKPSGAKKTARR